jgi:hypothetical protein
MEWVRGAVSARSGVGSGELGGWVEWKVSSAMQVAFPSHLEPLGELRLRCERRQRDCGSLGEADVGDPLLAGGLLNEVQHCGQIVPERGEGVG